jgi:signal transduction histidine kinase
MEKLLNDLLLYSRMGREYYQGLENVDLNRLIEEIIEVLSPPPGFTFQVQPNMPALMTYRTPLELVLKNLIENAIKHHHQATGQIQVSAVEQEGLIEFSVSDDGPGIDPMFHERIFQLFQTLQPRDKSEGSGAGLAIAKRAVESRGGAITVISAEGQGSIFRFTWPNGPTNLTS